MNQILIHLILEIYWKCKSRYSFADLNQRQDFFGSPIREKVLKKIKIKPQINQDM